jgi:F-type H+-transporting ATPase subunit b
VNLVGAGLFILLWASSAAAAEEHAAPISHILYPLLNFLIFLYLLKRFALPLARDYFHVRREQIARSLNEAAIAKERMEEKVQDYRERFVGLKEEIRKIHEAFVAEGEREKSRLLEEARALATKIRADSDFLAGQEFKVAQHQLRLEMARMAHAAAERSIRSHLTAADERRLIDEFVTGVGGAR